MLAGASRIPSYEFRYVPCHSVMIQWEVTPRMTLPQVPSPRGRRRLAVILSLVLVLAVSLAAAGFVFPLYTNQPVVVSTCGSQVEFNGTRYCSLDVTYSTKFVEPGYATMNNMVKFMGVLFSTVCPDDQSNCGKGTVTIYTDFILVKIVFADGLNETLGTPLQIHTTLYFLSSHTNPRAGFSVVGSNTAGGSYPYVKLYFLVEASQ